MFPMPFFEDKGFSGLPLKSGGLATASAHRETKAYFAAPEKRRA
jgi:hypothetical protein